MAMSHEAKKADPLPQSGSTEPESTGIERSLHLVESPLAPGHSRIIELDVLRGLAVVLMVAFHLTIDLKLFAEVDLGLPRWYWRAMPKIIGSMFFCLVGISAWLLFLTQGDGARRAIAIRGAKFCLIATGITAATALATPAYTIYFGVIHCIGVSTLLCYPFLRDRRYNLPLGILLIVAGAILRQFPVSFFWLFWLGVSPNLGNGGDWYPLLPWFGVVLLGIWIGERTYPALHKPDFLTEKRLVENPPIQALTFLGRHSLLIYLVHQPILVGAVTLLRTYL